MAVKLRMGNWPCLAMLAGAQNGSSGNWNTTQKRW